MNDLINQLLADMASVGIVPTDPGAIQFDTTEIVRFHVAGDKLGTRSGWWKGYSDQPPAGIFGSWKTGAKHAWRPDNFDEAHRQDWRERIEALKRHREAQLASAQAEVAERARERFMALPEASPEHPYCRKKRITPYGARQDGNRLVLAIQDWGGAIHSLQTISPAGRKMMAKGGRKKGLHIHVGGNPEGRLLICEGYATGCSLVDAYPDDEVIVAIDAYNMRPVAMTSRSRFPDREIVLAADHDETGIRCAKAAARAVGGTLLIPPEPGLDWNDYLMRGY
ncbi:MAG: toprim domain-containing protein [Acidithiobacillus sp.]|uniref:toprim domain-containing protein n=1 Tax=Acidithiobacillus sp. TaxID=1872118 RepID=UPI003D054D9D